MSVFLFIFKYAFFICVLVQANIQDSKEENQNRTGIFPGSKTVTGLLPISPLSQLGILKIAGEVAKKGKK